MSCGDDNLACIWDWEMFQEERKLKGHGWEVKSVDWHPHYALIVTGSKDNDVKLWDPRKASELSTLFGHKHTVMKTVFSPDGHYLATFANDN